MSARNIRCQVLVCEADLAAIERWLEAPHMLVPDAAQDIIRCVATQARVIAPRRECRVCGRPIGFAPHNEDGRCYECVEQGREVLTQSRQDAKEEA